MQKKIIDIFPPKSVSRQQKVLGTEKQKTGRSIWKKALLVIFLIFIFASVSLHFFFAEAEIELWPKTEPFGLQESINVDAKGRVFETEKTLSEEFLASGSSLKKAEGTIRLYNSFTTANETWLQGTRFVSSEGKLFFSKERITIPGATLKSGRITPSFIDAPVIAAEAGEDYNIGPSKFSIAAFLGTARYTKYYGESTSPMTGGGKVAQVLKKDLESAENNLIERVKEKMESELNGETKVGKIDILEKSSSAKEGEEKAKFEFSIKVKLTAVSFDSEDIEELAGAAVASRIPAERHFDRARLKTAYSVESINQKQDQLLISLSVSTKIYPALDLNALKKVLAGKPLPEAKILLAKEPDIVRAEIKVFPFWLQNLPGNFERVKIGLNID